MHNKDTDRPVHSHSLISAFVVRDQYSIMSSITRLKVPSVAKQAGLRFTWCQKLRNQNFSQQGSWADNLPITLKWVIHLSVYITKTSPCNEDPLTPYFYTLLSKISYFCSKT